MPWQAEPSPRRLLAHGVLAILVALAAIPGYLLLDPSWRPLALRAACAALVLAAGVRLRRSVARALDEQVPSALDAPPEPPPPAELDPRFQRVREDVVFGTRSRSYFEAIVWPRLLALAGGTLTPPPRRGRRRGPPPRALDRLITEAESAGESR